jgi:hypothetical protein
MLGTLIFGFLLAGTILVAYGTAVKNRWGINLAPAEDCPRCAAKVPLVRIPRSSGQFLWGDRRCHNCGCEIDKWGREIR